ncbi:hypothetical protein ACJA25_02135 [Mycoplasmopsis hyopharyngis]|uniref:hypothetical protein n=1 Tax=Mycoplasmopsis hyopharyngis TaxID=29558 RepID=UPI0038738B59
MVFNKIENKTKVIINIFVLIFAIFYGLIKTFLIKNLNEPISFNNAVAIRIFSYMSYIIPTTLIFISIWAICEILKENKDKKTILIVLTVIILSLLILILSLANGNYTFNYKWLNLTILVLWILLSLLLLFYIVIYVIFKKALETKRENNETQN